MMHAQTQARPTRRPEAAATAEQLHAALAAVAEAIDIPLAADGDADEIRDEILAQRAGHAAHAVQTILKHMDDAAIVRGAIVQLQQRASSPYLAYAGCYTTWDEAHGADETASDRPAETGWRRCAQQVLRVVRADAS